MRSSSRSRSKAARRRREDPLRRARGRLPRRPDRLQSAPRRLHPVERITAAGGTRFWIFSQEFDDVVEGPPAEGPGQRRRADVDRVEGSFPASDRDGEFNLFSLRPGPKDVKQLTPTRISRFSTPRPARRMDHRAGRLPPSLRPRPGQEPPARRSGSRPTSASSGSASRRARWVRGGGPSPSGARAVFEFRGEIVTVPAEKGDPRNLTQTPGAHERSLGLVARREVDRLFLGRLGRIRAPRPRPGRQGRGEGLQARRRRLLRLAGLVAGQPRDRLRRQLPGRFTGSISRTGAERRSARNTSISPAGRRTMCASWPPTPSGSPTPSGTPTYFQKVYVYSLDQDKSFPDHGRPERGRRAGLRRRGQVSLLLRLDRRRAGQAVVRHVERRHAADERRSMSPP